MVGGGQQVARLEAELAETTARCDRVTEAFTRLSGGTDGGSVATSELGAKLVAVSTELEGLKREKRGADKRRAALEVENARLSSEVASLRQAARKAAKQKSPIEDDQGSSYLGLGSCF